MSRIRYGRMPHDHPDHPDNQKVHRSRSSSHRVDDGRSWFNKITGSIFVDPWTKYDSDDPHRPRPTSIMSSQLRNEEHARHRSSSRKKHRDDLDDERRGRSSTPRHPDRSIHQNSYSASRHGQSRHGHHSPRKHYEPQLERPGEPKSYGSRSRRQRSRSQAFDDGRYEGYATDTSARIPAERGSGPYGGSAGPFHRHDPANRRRPHGSSKSFDEIVELPSRVHHGPYPPPQENWRFDGISEVD